MRKEGAASAFPQKVLAFVHEHHLWQRGSRILAAVSGGPDSLGLLLFLHGVAGKEGIQVGCCCVDHHLRPGSGAEADYVARVCRDLAIPFIRKDVDVAGERQKKGGSLETVARTLRYQALRKAAADGQYDAIALAHHADDQAETVLFHFLRGAGARGLSGMAPKSGDLVRPFLFVTKGDIGAYVSCFPYTPCHDETNDVPDATRNQIRLLLLPELLSYNPRLVRDISRAADIFREEDRYMESEASSWLTAHARREDAVWELPQREFLALPPAMQRRVLLGAVGSLKNGEVDARGIERMRRLAASAPGKRTDAAGVVMETGREVLSFYPGSTRRGGKLPREDLLAGLYENFTQNSRAKLASGKRTAIISRSVQELDGWEMAVELCSAPPSALERNQCLLDADKVGRPVLRYPRKDEALAPRGMEGTKSMSRILSEAGIPASLRPWWPCVSDEHHIYWAVLLRGSRFGQVDAGTRRFLVLTLTYNKETVTWKI